MMFNGIANPTDSELDETFFDLFAIVPLRPVMPPEFAEEGVEGHIYFRIIGRQSPTNKRIVQAT